VQNPLNKSAFADIQSPPHVSLQILSKSLGLSISTVSRALNGYADVSEATRLRVSEAAKAMNYQPNPAAHRLATGRTGAVALVSAVRPGRALDPTFATLQAGAAAVLREHGYFVLSMTLPAGDGELPELERLLAARLVDGVMLTRTHTLDLRVKLLQAAGIPFVTHGRTQNPQQHAWVDTDNEEAIYIVTRRLIELGHRRIGFINGPLSMTYAVLREAGFDRACRESADVTATTGHVQDVTARNGEEMMHEWLGAGLLPTAVVCATDALAFGAMAACKAAGLKIGPDISITGYGNTEASAFVDPPLTTIDHATEANGGHLADLLLQAIAGGASPALQRLEPVHLLERASVCPVPKP
jgi:LacI family transcriptional regulator